MRGADLHAYASPTNQVHGSYISCYVFSNGITDEETRCCMLDINELKCNI
jgi:hypothetical protein